MPDDGSATRDGGGNVDGPLDEAADLLMAARFASVALDDPLLVSLVDMALLRLAELGRGQSNF